MSSKRKRDGESKKGKSNYQTIGGKKYDRGMIAAVDSATEDKDKINTDDCKKLFAEIIDGNKYTDVEKATMKYIRENYKFEKEADQWIRREIASWAAKKAAKEAQKGEHKSETKKEEKADVALLCSCNEPDDGTLLVGCDSQLAGCYNWYHAKCVGLPADKDKLPDVWFCENCTKKGKKPVRGKKEKPKKESYYKQIDNKKYDKGMLDAADAAGGKIGDKDAKNIFQEAVDGDRITECEYDTLDYIKSKYSFTEKATAWLEKALKKWEEDHPRKKARAPREKKEKKEEKKGGRKKAKGKPPKKKAKAEKAEDDGDDDDGEGEAEDKSAEKKENGQKADDA